MRLNARQRNPKVRYALFLGTGGPLNEQSLKRWREPPSERGKHGLVRFVSHNFVGPCAEHLLEDLDELIQGKGDGAVALARGRLEGVEDTVVLGFVHHAMMDGPAEASRQLRSKLLERLTR